MQFKNAVALSLFFHAGIFCLALVPAAQPDIGILNGKYVVVDLIRPSGGIAATTRGSNRRREAIPETSIPPEIPPAVTVHDDRFQKTEPNDRAETQTAVESVAHTHARGVSEREYQPFYKLGKMPAFRFQKTPLYPLAARSAGVETRVVVEVFISARGTVDDVKLIKSGGAGFDEAVFGAVRQSSFEPGEVEGRPVASRVRIPYLFKLK